MAESPHSPPDGGIASQQQPLLDEMARQARLFDATLSAISDFAYSFDRSGRFTYINKALLDLWGLSSEQAIGKDFFDLKYPDPLAAKLQRQIQTVFDTQKGLRDETPYTSPTGKGGFYEYIFAPVFADDGTVEAVAGSTRDITARKQLEVDRERLVLAVENQQARLASMIEHAPAFICILQGPQHVFELVNERYYEIVGRRDIVGRSVRDALPEVEGQGFFELLDDVYNTGNTFSGDAMPVRLRRNGDDSLDDRFMNFVYQALREFDGTISGIFVHGFDVTDLVRSREEVRTSERRFRQLADAMPQIVWVTLADGYHEYYNRRWYEFTGVPEGSTDGEGWNEMFHPDDRQPAWSAWRRSLATGEPYEIEYRLRHRSGEYRWTLGRALPVRNARGDIERWFGTCTDIDSMKRLTEERQSLLEAEQAARAQAERAGRMKDDFLATLSHEIRTPLNAILGWSQIIKRPTTKADDVAKGLNVIERSARAQAQIIEDLLDMSRLISGKVRLDVQPLDLSAVVQAAVETFRPTAEAKGVRLRSVIDPLHGIVVSGDASRLQQVMSNLISNALKFTPKGGRVQVLLERADSHLEVSVIDTGEGIDPEFLPFVFDRFRQADASTTRQHGGLGLGLSIVKQLVELHGGSVHVKSPGPGHGSTFVVAIPITVVHPTPEPGADRRHPRTESGMIGIPDSCVDIEGVRVLVVDDEADARALVTRVLEECKAVVTATGSVDEAVRLVEGGAFDVLVSDIGMPGEDGYSLIRRVRSLGKDKGGGVPAIALTAYARAEDRVRAVAAGFQMHVAKPVEPVELVTMVASAVGRTGRLE